MTQEARFWRNVAIIGVAHVALLLGLARWSAGTKGKRTAEILWIEGGAGSTPAVAERTEALPRPEPEITATPVEAATSPEPLASDIQLPAPSPSPTPSVTPTS